AMLSPEDQRIEYKSEWSDKILNNVSAFANTDGGTIHLGVRDDGEVIGFVWKNDLEQQACINKLWSLGMSRSPRIEFVEYDGKICISITVFRAYVVRPNGRFG